MPDKSLAWIALNLLTGIGPVRAQRLAESLGGPEQAFLAPPEALAAVPDLRPEIIHGLQNFAWREAAEQELERCTRLGGRVLTLEDADYPALLRAIPFPPPVLYLRGRLVPEDEQALAVVGCRRPSAYGQQAARDLTLELARAGLTIVSGLALGVDAEAHHAALDAGGRTLAVLAHGVDQIYPPANRKLHGRILENGAVLSEFPLTTLPHKGNFPRRNRIISGLALGVLVVEAGARSGSLITARWAVEQGREVFALPGQYHSALSEGTHALIQEGAKLVSRVQDILAEILPETAARPQPAAQSRAPLPEILTPTQVLIFQALANGSRHVDQLAAACQCPVSQVMTDLLALEMQGLVACSPGQIYHWLGKQN